MRPRLIRVTDASVSIAPLTWSTTSCAASSRSRRTRQISADRSDGRIVRVARPASRLLTGRALQPGLLAYRAAHRTDVDVECLDIQCIAVAFAGAGFWIDDDQRVVDDLKNRGSVVPQILSLRQDPKVAERADEARIVRLQVCGPYGTDRMAITLLQQQPDQSCGACEFHCLPASRE